MKRRSACLKRNLQCLSVLLLAAGVWAGGINDYPWLNKQIILNSTTHYQFYNPVSHSTMTITPKAGRVETTAQHWTTNVETVTFETKEADVGVMKASQLRVLDSEWAPENGWTILNDIAFQITNALALSADLRPGKTNVVWHRPFTSKTGPTKTNVVYKLDLLLKSEPIISLQLEPSERPGVYWFGRSFAGPQKK